MMFNKKASFSGNMRFPTTLKGRRLKSEYECSTKAAKRTGLDPSRAIHREEFDQIWWCGFVLYSKGVGPREVLDRPRLEAQKRDFVA